MMLEVINKVFDKMVVTICSGIDENDCPTIKEEYKNLLHRRYSDSDVMLKINDYDRLFKIIYSIEYKEWVNHSPNIKKGLLIQDEALNQIMDISNTGFNLALKKFNDNTLESVKNVNEEIEKMNKLYDQVRDENKWNAEKYISEGTVDFLYASGQSEAMSLRMGRYPKKK